MGDWSAVVVSTSHQNKYSELILHNFLVISEFSKSKDYHAFFLRKIMDCFENINQIIEKK